MKETFEWWICVSGHFLILLPAFAAIYFYILKQPSGLLSLFYFLSPSPLLFVSHLPSNDKLNIQHILYEITACGVKIWAKFLCFLQFKVFYIPHINALRCKRKQVIFKDTLTEQNKTGTLKSAVTAWCKTCRNSP